MSDVLKVDDYDIYWRMAHGGALMRLSEGGRVMLTPNECIVPKTYETSDLIALILDNEHTLDALIEHGADVLNSKLLERASDQFRKAAIAEVGRGGTYPLGPTDTTPDAPQKPASRELIQRELEKACSAVGFTVKYDGSDIDDGIYVYSFKVGSSAGELEYEFSNDRQYSEILNRCARIVEDVSYRVELEKLKTKPSGPFPNLGVPQ